MRSEGSPASMAGMKTGRKEKLPQRAGDGGSPVQASLAGNPSEPRPELEFYLGSRKRCVKELVADWLRRVIASAVRKVAPRIRSCPSFCKDRLRKLSGGAFLCAVLWDFCRIFIPRRKYVRILTARNHAGRTIPGSSRSERACSASTACQSWAWCGRPFHGGRSESLCRNRLHR